MKNLEAMGHDATDRIAAMRLAMEYGEALYTGVFYRDPTPSPTYDSELVERRRAFGTLDRARALDRFALR